MNTVTAAPITHEITIDFAPELRTARGIDLLVMRASLAMLLWARRRSDRTAINHEQRARQVRTAQATERREHAAALLAARVR